MHLVLPLKPGVTSVDPTRQVTVEQIRKKDSRFPNDQFEIGKSSKPRVTTRILLNKWQRQQEKERYKGVNVKKRKGDTRKKDIGKNKRNMLGSRNVHIGGAH